MPNQNDKGQHRTYRPTDRRQTDIVQQQSEDSFPASDPPSFTPIRRDGTPSNREAEKSETKPS